MDRGSLRWLEGQRWLGGQRWLKVARGGMRVLRWSEVVKGSSRWYEAV